MLSAAAASAQDPPSPKQLELAERYLAATDTEKAIDAMTAAFRKSLAGSGMVASMTSIEQDKFIEIVGAVSRDAVRDARPKFRQAVAETFTEKELEDILTFFDTPTGRSYKDKVPNLAAHTTTIMQDMMPSIMGNLMTGMCDAGLPCFGKPKADQPSKPS